MLEITQVCQCGNCMFLSVCLNGHEREHSSLRQLIGKHMEAGTKPALLMDKAVRAHITNVCTDGKWAGEDVLLCAADLLKQEIHLYIAADKFSPIVYKPRTGPFSDVICLAFYEPGHYRAVMKKLTGYGNAINVEKTNC